MGEQTNIIVDSKRLEPTDCAHCNRALVHKRITLKSLLIDGINVVFNLERGFLFTLKILLTKPSVVLKDYLDGDKRYLYYNPFRLAFILVSLSTFIYFSTGFIDTVINLENTDNVNVPAEQFREIIKKYANIISLISVPFIGLGTFLVFKKLNYAEHLVACFYLFALSSLIGMVFFPFYYLAPHLYKAQQLVSTLVLLTYLTLMFKGFFRMGTGKAIIKSLFSLVLGIIGLLLFTTLIVLGVIMTQKLL